MGMTVAIGTSSNPLAAGYGFLLSQERRRELYPLAVSCPGRGAARSDARQSRDLWLRWTPDQQPNTSCRAASGERRPAVRLRDGYPLAAPALENRRRMRIMSPSQTSR
ncbi:hypothetical protein V1290_004595 [Bradyrhizobium sp. AZCC 1578]